MISKILFNMHEKMLSSYFDNLSLFIAQSELFFIDIQHDYLFVLLLNFSTDCK